MNRFYRLMAFGYFPKELPPVFFSGGLANIFQRNHATFTSVLDKTWRRPTPYLLQQRSYYRRTLSILNPPSYAALAQEVASNYANIQGRLSDSEISVSSPRFNRKTKFHRAVGSSRMSSSFRERKILIRSQYPVIVRFDIKNFYRSIYTHSIPWALHGKQACKQNLRLGRRQRSIFYGDNIDECLRLNQDGQTIGIPVGPDTSFIIAEIILSAVDKEMGFGATEGARFYDDYEVGCNSVEEAEKTIARMESVLAGYELELNHDKTKIVTSHAVSDAWPFQMRLHTKSINPQSRDDLIDLYNIAVNTAAQFPDASVLKYFIRQMRRIVLSENQWPLWQELLYTSGFSERGSLREIFEQLDLYSGIGYHIDKKKLKLFLVKKITQELSTAVTSELSWAIFGVNRFDIRIERSLLTAVIERGDDVSRLLAIQYSFRKGIGIKRPISALMHLWQPEVFKTSQHWLLMWELHVNGWITNRDLRQDVAQDPFFALLESHDISFMRPATTDLLEIPNNFRTQMAQPRLNSLLGQISSRFQLPPEDLDTGDSIDVDENDDLGSNNYFEYF